MPPVLAPAWGWSGSPMRAACRRPWPGPWLRRRLRRGFGSAANAAARAASRIRRDLRRAALLAWSTPCSAAWSSAETAALRSARGSPEPSSRTRRARATRVFTEARTVRLRPCFLLEIPMRFLAGLDVGHGRGVYRTPAGGPDLGRRYGSPVRLSTCGSERGGETRRIAAAGALLSVAYLGSRVAGYVRDVIRPPVRHRRADGPVLLRLHHPGPADEPDPRRGGELRFCPRSFGATGPRRGPGCPRGHERGDDRGPFRSRRGWWCWSWSRP